MGGGGGACARAGGRGGEVGSRSGGARCWRGGSCDAVGVAAAREAMNRVFASDLGPLRAARDVGLGLVDRMAPLKKIFVSEAAGDAGDAPRLLRGEPV